MYNRDENAELSYISQTLVLPLDYNGILHIIMCCFYVKLFFGVVVVPWLMAIHVKYVDSTKKKI